MADSPPGISAAPKDDNLRHFDVTVSGPESSPYEGECFSPLHVCESSQADHNNTAVTQYSRCVACDF